jgi:hypothetical protein
VLSAAYRSFVEVGVTIGIVFALEGLASCAVQTGRLTAAVQVFAWSTAIRAEMGDPRPPMEQRTVDADLAVLRSSLGAAPFAAAWQQGCTLSSDAAAILVLVPDE